MIETRVVTFKRVSERTSMWPGCSSSKGNRSSFLRFMTEKMLRDVNDIETRIPRAVAGIRVALCHGNESRGARQSQLLLGVSVCRKQEQWCSQIQQ